MNKFLLIAGSKGSGKGLIRGLLDGHEHLFVSPYHELIFQSFYSKGHNKLHDLESVRTALSSKGRYYQLERLSYEQKRNHHIAAGIKDKGIDINFDFYEFDKFWAQNLITNNAFKSEEICFEIYNSFHKHLKSDYLHFSDSVKYFCALSGDDPFSIPLFLETYPNSKVIHISRNPVEIISSVMGRKPPSFNGGFKKYSRQKLTDIYCSYEFVSSIICFNIEAEKALKKYPSRVLSIDFDSFFKDRLGNTAKIANFLNIENNSILENYSSVGCKIFNPDGSSMLNSPIDKGCEHLTKSEVEKIKIHIKNAISEFS